MHGTVPYVRTEETKEKDTYSRQRQNPKLSLSVSESVSADESFGIEGGGRGIFNLENNCLYVDSGGFYSASK